MPSTAVTTENELLTSTLRSFIKAKRSMQDRPVKFLDDLEKLGKRESTGGERIQIDWETNRHSQATRLTTGYEVINVTGQKVGTPGFEDWGEVVYPIISANREEWKNRGMAKRLDILERRTSVTWHQARQDAQRAYLQGGVSGWEDITPINGFDDTTGFLEDAAVGSQSNTLHGLARSSFATLPGFQNQVYDCAGSFSANGLIALDEVTSYIQELAGEGGTKLRGYMSIEFGNNLKRASRTYERFYSEKEWDGGKLIQIWNGTAMQALHDAHGLPRAGSVTTADPISCIFLDFSCIQVDAQKDYWFNTGEFRHGVNQLVKWAPLHIVSNLVAEYLGSSAVIYDADLWP